MKTMLLYAFVMSRIIHVAYHCKVIELKFYYKLEGVSYVACISTVAMETTQNTTKISHQNMAVLGQNGT